ncbi:hypothetical protein Cantr_02307 [Candida viswanathii]|uniref:Uncharacterized protein n=1 Tax=Candida viswanathii TaxID=5486 RepID=A0A367YNP8_9ASCO|nr:hypothetical protein Cantr_02307 [Candida viswanathii]
MNRTSINNGNGNGLGALANGNKGTNNTMVTQLEINVMDMDPEITANVTETETETEIATETDIANGKEMDSGNDTETEETDLIAQTETQRNLLESKDSTDTTDNGKLEELINEVVKDTPKSTTALEHELELELELQWELGSFTTEISNSKTVITEQTGKVPELRMDKFEIEIAIDTGQLESTERQIVGLVDSGATSNFIDHRLVDKWKLEKHKCAETVVTGAFGGTTVIDQLVTLKFERHGNLFEDTFAVLPNHKKGLIFGLPFIRKYSNYFDFGLKIFGSRRGTDQAEIVVGNKLGEPGTVDCPRNVVDLAEIVEFEHRETETCQDFVHATKLDKGNFEPLVATIITERLGPTLSSFETLLNGILLSQLPRDYVGLLQP